MAYNKELIKEFTRIKRLYVNNYQQIKQDYSFGGGQSSFQTVPNPKYYTSKGKSTRQLRSMMRLMERHLDPNYREILIRQEWTRYMDCLKINEQNKFKAFDNAYGYEVSTQMILAVFQDKNFRDCKGFVSRDGDNDGVGF